MQENNRNLNFIETALAENAATIRQLIETQSNLISEAADKMVESYRNEGKILVFGNGGSAADAQHLAAEFVGRFVRERKPLPAIALTTDTSAITAIANDYGYEEVFARQIRALGRAGDVAIAISTSGRSPGILKGVEVAREMGITTIGLTGGDGGLLSSLVDIAIVVQAKRTARIQEAHLLIEHLFCEIVEETLFGNE